MGQILGLGLSQGDKQKTTSTPKIPGWLEPSLRTVSGTMASGAPYFQEMFGRMFQQDPDVVKPYTRPLAGTYTPGASAYMPIAPTFSPLAKAYTDTSGTYTPIAPSYTPLAPSYQKAAPAVVAPMWQRAKDAIEELQ